MTTARRSSGIMASHASNMWLPPAFTEGGNTLLGIRLRWAASAVPSSSDNSSMA